MPTGLRKQHTDTNIPTGSIQATRVIALSSMSQTSQQAYSIATTLSNSSAAGVTKQTVYPADLGVFLSKLVTGVAHVKHISHRRARLHEVLQCTWDVDFAAARYEGHSTD